MDVMLTTVDNPFDPFTEYDAWLSYDHQLGYFTNEYLARVATTSDDLAETEQDDDIEQAIDEIVRENILGVYKKVYKS